MASVMATARTLTIGPALGSQDTHIRAAVYSPELMSSRLIQRTIVVKGPIKAGLVVVEPLFVTLRELPGGEFVANDDTLFVYGVGPTVQRAYDDYLGSLVEYYELVALHADESTPARDLLRAVHRYVRPEPL